MNNRQNGFYWCRTGNLWSINYWNSTRGLWYTTGEVIPLLERDWNEIDELQIKREP